MCRSRCFLNVALLARARRQHYGAERMSLVVLGGEPLDILQGWVAEIFTGLPTGKGPRPDFKDKGPPYEVCVGRGVEVGR